MEVDKRLNKRGFTLIELLAVIVILAILMTLAITSMSGVISKAKKDTYVTTALQYSNSIRFKLVNGDYISPAAGKCTVVPTSLVELDSGKNRSPFDKNYNEALSYIAIYNSGTAELPKYSYYIQMVDQEGNGFALVEENVLSADNVLVKGITETSGGAKTMPTVGGNLALTGDLNCQVEAVES